MHSVVGTITTRRPYHHSNIMQNGIFKYVDFRIFLISKNYDYKYNFT